MKKLGKVILAVAAALVVCAVVLGLLNGLVAKGAWTFGWVDYQYDESGFTAGGASVTAPNADRLKRIEIDWIDGSVQVIPCQDICVSMTESAEGDMGEGNELRWKLSEDGTTLTVRYRKSSWFFLGTHKENKTLTLRVPERFFGQLEELDVKVRSSQVTVTGLTLSTLRFSAEQGSLTVRDCATSEILAATQGGSIGLSSPICPQKLDLQTRGGDVTLALGTDASFALDWQTEGGNLISDLPLTSADGAYRYGEGKAELRVKTAKGDLQIKEYKPEK